ncbi:MAG: YutD family protein [Tenericutes bacterium]|nr:YutD family protein [Mycoplasmatota bacterium]
MIIEIDNKRYKVIKDYKDAFDKEEFIKKYTSFFYEYDYIVGDIAYSKLRLKGFTKKENKIHNKINDFVNVEKYIEENCAFDCKHFILEKL